MEILKGIAIGCLVVPTTALMALALYYHWRWFIVRIVVALAPVAVVAGAFCFLPAGSALLVWALALSVVVAWWRLLRSRAQRDWAVGMDVLPRVQIDGDLIKIQNFRNFDYDADGQAIVRYEERTFDLRRLKSMDYFLAHWSGPVIAHTLASFGFDDGQYLAVSVEARRQRWQRYSPLWGVFRAYELMFVLGDEHDVIRLRTHIRRERVYLYRIRLSADELRPQLLDYLQRAESLATRPEWYNSVTSNCTTNLAYYRQQQIHWWAMSGMLLNGMSARTLYQLGFLADSLPFAELKQRSCIDARKIDGQDQANFSQCIRAGLVEPTPRVVPTAAPAPSTA